MMSILAETKASNREHQPTEGQTHGTTRIASFERGIARLVAHEVDHLDGILYRSRMNDDTEPIHVIECKGRGKQRRYLRQRARAAEAPPSHMLELPYKEGPGDSRPDPFKSGISGRSGRAVH